MSNANDCTQCFTREMKQELVLFAIITRVNTVGWMIGIFSLLYTFFVLRSMKSGSLSKPIQYLLALGLAALTALLLVYSGFCIWERICAIESYWPRYRPEQFQFWWWNSPDRRPNEWITFISMTTSFLMSCLVIFLVARMYYNQYMLIPVLVIETLMLAIPMSFRFVFVFQIGITVFLLSYICTPSFHRIVGSKERRALIYFTLVVTAQTIVSILDRILIRRDEFQALDFNISVAVQAFALVYLAQGGWASPTGEIALTEEEVDA